MKNILVVNVNWLGDCIFSSPVFRALKDNFPQSRITCLAVPRVHEILECIPQIDRIMTYDEKGEHRYWWAKWGLARQLKKEKFDTALLLRPSASRAMLLAMAQIPVRIGYAKKGRAGFLTHPVVEPKETMHRSDYYLRVIESAGVKVKTRKTFLQCDATAGQEVDVLLRQTGLKENESFMVINPGGNWLLKRWPVRNYIELIKAIGTMLPQRIVLTGAAGDVALGEQIMREVGSSKIVNMVGKTNLKQLMALFKKSAFAISNDSGPLHIANSVGTKVVGIFGPTRPEITAPRGDAEVYLLQKDIGCNLFPCYYLDCPNNLCMQAIKVKDVLDALGKITH